MVFAGDDIDADDIGEDGFLDDLPYRPGVADESAGVVDGHVAERVQAENEIRHGWPSS